MKKSLVGAFAVALSGCTAVSTVEGFSEVAARGEVVSIDGGGWGRSGHFTVAPLGIEGAFRRSSGWTEMDGDKLAGGHLSFALSAEGEFAGLGGECGFSRETFETSAQLSRRTTVQTSTVTGPYVMTCSFLRDGEEIGGIEINEEQGRSLDVRELRSGHAGVGLAEMRLTSLHQAPGLGSPTSTPLGYAMDFRGGEQAMLFSNGLTRQVALPREGRDARAAALLSGIALALIWNPDEGD